MRGLVMLDADESSCRKTMEFVNGLLVNAEVRGRVMVRASLFMLND